MSLAAGVRLGPYEIVAPIGAGGMGEVYRARDTRLDRTVAIKVLPEALSSDPQLRERFGREARTISSLNHPHICALYDVGHEAGVDFLVLEFLEGETLAERLERAGTSKDPTLPIPDALQIGIDIVDALDAAHRAGIVHRDLKPANVFLVRRGSSQPPAAKLLDFGLAKAAGPVIATSGLSMLPTTPPNLTAQGTILGTFQYMAPEQIEGLEADARTDIFAFGAVMLEMLTGRRAFEGKTRAQLLGSILKDEPPPPSTLRAGVPKALDRVIRTCLEKDPDDRWQSARDLGRELKWAAESSAGDGAFDSSAASATSHGDSPAKAGHYIRRVRVAWITAGALALALIATGFIAVRHLLEAPTATDTLQFTVPAPDNAQFGGPPGGGTGSATQVALSPDGRHVAFIARAQNGNTYALWIRSLGALASRQIPGADDASFPFWSPDSRFVGFFSGGKLKKVQLAGGPPIALCDAPQGRGGAWNRDNVIVFGLLNSPMQRVSSAGGAPSPVLQLDKQYGETSHRWPHFLPDGTHFFFTAVTGALGAAPKPSIVKIGSLDGTAPTDVLNAESSAVYADGHLLFANDSTLMAQPFDAVARTLKGDPFPIAEQVSAESSRYAGFSASQTGTLAYGRGTLSSSSKLTWFDRSGKTLGDLGEPGVYLTVALSRDDRRAAATMSTGSPPNADIWILDTVRGTNSRLTFDPAQEAGAVWSADGSQVMFTSVRPPESGFHRKPSNGTGADEVIWKSTNVLQNPFMGDWSPDGRFVAYESITSGSNALDIWILPLTGEKKPFPFVQGPGSDQRPIFSPDGRWIAYTSDESGVAQVYVQPFPSTGGRSQVSKSGGTQPMWRGDGKEMFFIAFDGTMTATPVDTTHQFESGSPQPLFRTNLPPTARKQYAVSRDGQRFLMIVPRSSGANASSLPITVVTNWLGSVQK